MEDASKVGGTNPLVVPGVKKLGGPVPPVPMVVAPTASDVGERASVWAVA